MRKRLLSLMVAIPLLLSVFILAFAFDSKAEGDIFSQHYALVDDSEIPTLSDAEKTMLLSEMKEAYENSGWSVYIWITTEVGMDSGWEDYMQQVAASFKDTDKVLMFISMKEGEHVVCIDSYDADKKGASYFLNSKRLTKIKDGLLDDLTAGDYYTACHKYINGINIFKTKNPKFDSILFKWYAHLGLAVIIAIIVVFSQIAGMGGAITVDERTYLNKDKSKILGRFDRYTHTTREVVHHESSNSSSGGGGHSSSGGSSF